MRVLLHMAVLISVASAVVSQYASAHPSDGYPPSEMPPMYGEENYGYSPDWGINELYFLRPYPDPSTLTDSEKYIITGTASSAHGWGLQAWRDQVIDVVNVYYSMYGVIPPQLSEDVLLAVHGTDYMPAEELEVFKSPLTGEYPMLNAVDFSPGDIYIRPLTEAEKQHFTSLSPRWNNMWNHGIEPYLDTGYGYQIEILSDVYYVRIYGWNEPIITKIHFDYVRI